MCCVSKLYILFTSRYFYVIISTRVNSKPHPHLVMFVDKLKINKGKQGLDNLNKSGNNLIKTDKQSVL